MTIIRSPLAWNVQALLPVTRLVLTVALFIASEVNSSDYLGAYLGKLNSYAHQVNGDVYLIDEYTFLIKNFFYDGLSQDAFFWAGS